MTNKTFNSRKTSARENIKTKTPRRDGARND